MSDNKNQYNGRISSGQTKLPTNQNGINIQSVNITRPPTYTLTVGFEVNYPTAFVNNTQNLGMEDPKGLKIGDFGHGFFYVTNNSDIIVTSISFGPENNIIENTKSGQARKGTIDYHIGEVTQLFRFTINEQQNKALIKAVTEFEAKVKAKKILYDPLWNNTCAACARMLLDDSDINTPSGKGYVTGTGFAVADFVAGIIQMTIPYKWHENHVVKYGAGIEFKGLDNKAKPDLEYFAFPTKEINLSKVWYVTPGLEDPLLSKKDSKGPVPLPIPHGDLRGAKK